VLGYSVPGEKRIHRVLEGDLYVLVQAGVALIALDAEGLTGRNGHIMPAARADLDRAIARARESIAEREKYG